MDMTQDRLLVLDRVRIVGKGTVLVIGWRPKGLDIGSEVSKGDFKFKVTGIGWMSNRPQHELILSPNDLVDEVIKTNDVITILPPAL